MGKDLKLATFGGGCFWCTEAVFQKVKGVEKVISGYSGGNVPGKPTYREISSGLTGHAEVIQITFDANTISYEDILVIFMTTHDPTTLNRQGADKGTHYRSVIFYHNENQKNISNEVLKQLQSYFDNKIVTEIRKNVIKPISKINKLKPATIKSTLKNKTIIQPMFFEHDNFNYSEEENNVD
jgi:peptide-methionine (S)-S-oxide reductase